MTQTQTQHFNLIDEPWVPVTGTGRVSLKQLFSHPEYRTLGGNPVEKIAMTKLLLALAQAADTPTDEAAWAKMGTAGMARSCLDYLDQHYDRFWLYGGTQPFLQMPEVVRAKKQSYGAVSPEKATGNTTVLTQISVEKPLSPAEQAVLLVCLMGFALGGKKADNQVVLTADYTGKSASAKPGPSLGLFGLLHSFLLGSSILETLWLNLLTHEHINGLRVLSAGLGQPPWEKMPNDEACDQAKTLQNSLMGRLLPLSRFCLLTDEGLHYSEGIAHPGYKEGMIDPSISIDVSGKEPKALWVDPEKRPWRFLTAMLSFIEQDSSGGFDCLYLRSGLPRARQHMPKRGIGSVGIWSGGLRVSSNAGEQFVSGYNDFVESTVLLDLNTLGEVWFAHLKKEMDGLDALSKSLYKCVVNYGKTLKTDNKKQAKQATNLFWQLCESKFQHLIQNCDKADQINQLRRTFMSFAEQCYNHFCPHGTARQLEAWAKNQSHLAIYRKKQIHPKESAHDSTP
ncbi:MAG: type I-E CRISPR-associated protein Cse1/CasA [Desulfobulbus sp.]|jgi:CRISPR system Cascade subunit CasA